MPLSNAERQKRFRETRKEKVSELDTLRNEITVLRAELQLAWNARDHFSQHNREMSLELDLLRNEIAESRTVRKKPRKLIEYLTEETAFFYVQDGVIKLLQWPETLGTIKAQGFEVVPYTKIDKKYRNLTNNLILEYNTKTRELNKGYLDAP